jgi:hypothetical protein
MCSNGKNKEINCGGREATGESKKIKHFVVSKLFCAGNRISLVGTLKSWFQVNQI